MISFKDSFIKRLSIDLNHTPTQSTEKRRSTNRKKNTRNETLLVKLNQIIQDFSKLSEDEIYKVSLII